MKTLIISVAIVIGTSNVLAQEREFKINIQLPEKFTGQEVEPSRFEPQRIGSPTGFTPKDVVTERSVRNFEWKSTPSDPQPTFGSKEAMLQYESDLDEGRLTRLPDKARGFDWKPALVQSGLFLAIQHGFRFTEPKTRRELDGPFFKDWKASVKNLRGWDDGGKTFTNYVGHPMQGAITGRIYVNNSATAKVQVIGRSKEYWLTRLKAMAWSAAWSTQFELGPISEASLGNVGQKLSADGRTKMTYGDLVITPVGGTGLLIAEDAVDKYLLRHFIEKRLRNHVVVKLLRSLLTPMTSFANVLRGRTPWWRDNRIRARRL